MLYQELEAVKNQKARLLKRLWGAKKAAKKKGPYKKKRLNPVMGSKLLQSSNRHLRNNSVQKSGYTSTSRGEEPPKRGRGYHMINDFRHSRGQFSTDQYSVFRSTVNRDHALTRAEQGRRQEGD